MARARARSFQEVSPYEIGWQENWLTSLNSHAVLEDCKWCYKNKHTSATKYHEKVLRPWQIALECVRNTGTCHLWPRIEGVSGRCVPLQTCRHADLMLPGTIYLSSYLPCAHRHNCSQICSAVPSTTRFAKIGLAKSGLAKFSCKTLSSVGQTVANVVHKSITERSAQLELEATIHSRLRGMLLSCCQPLVIPGLQQLRS